jgi:signal transduction histidine kinase/CheY-like chemotaxis protein
MAKETPQQERAARLGRAWVRRRVNAWLMRWLPRSPPQGDALRAALVTAAVACLVVALAPLYALLTWLLERPPTIYYGIALEAALGAAAALLLLRRGRLRSSAWLLLLVSLVAVATTLAREGSSSQAAGNLAITVVMAALLVGWRAALTTGLLSLTLVAVLGALEHVGLFHPTPPTHAQGVFALIQVGSIMVMLLVFDGVRLGLIEAQRELERRLAQGQRLEAVGRVAGGVAHDFNNLLTVILANASLMAESPLVSDASVHEIRAAAQRGSQLTKQLLAFSRQQKLEPRTFDLAALVTEERAMLARLIPETILIAVERPRGPVWAHADPGQISQVILNLVVNARDAMSGGGTLTIGVSRGAGRVLLQVRDTGVGMDSQTLERAFEPFFTTKGAVGTGLGLATVHGIVTQSGGQIRVRSGPAGTEFDVSLPAGEAPADARLLESSGELPRARRRMILLVEDDDAVRTATTRVLKALGHDVTACAEIGSALATWRADPAAIDLILSDIVMPGGGGPELLRALPPGHAARVLFMSGYTNDALNAPDLARVPFLAKPFTQRELACKLADVLGVSADPDPTRPDPRASRLDA